MKPRKIDRVAYYARGVVADLEPYALAERYKAKILARLEGARLPTDIATRVNYYNRMAPGQPVGDAPSIRAMPRDRSYYFYDLMPLAKCFGPKVHIRCLFGDVIRVPEKPSIVKSRPVTDDNANSVIMKLDRLRHFTVGTDTVAFDDKLPRAVWRGGLSGRQPGRLALVERWGKDPRHDIGAVGRLPEGVTRKGFLTQNEQLRYRYIVSVEGNDVATNLKWIMASRSLCMMTRPRFETWFMEGSLEPGVHYVELRDDYADLDEKVDHYERHRDEALAIVENANRHWRQFLDRPNEELVSLLVLQKYFEATGQIGPSAFSGQFFR